jgi:hypothetical protein
MSDKTNNLTYSLTWYAKIMKMIGLKKSNTASSDTREPLPISKNDLAQSVQRSESSTKHPSKNLDTHSQSVRYMIAFKGLNGAFETNTMTEWCRMNNYILKIFDYKEVDQAIKFVKTIPVDSHIEVWGYSRGAVAGYDLIRLTPTIKYDRLHTVGTYHTVTSSFGNSRPVPQNVGRHTNYVETHQQPKDFFNNPNNVSLGPVNHFEATKKALEVIL